MGARTRRWHPCNEKMIKACIFDLDGTLLNTLPTITHYVNKTITNIGLSEITVDECCSFVGHGARRLIESTLHSKGIYDTAIIDSTLVDYNARYDADTLYLTVPYDGIVTMIDALHSAGMRLAVLSNKPDKTTNDIIAKFFPDRFSKVQGGRADLPLKPAPDALLLMIDELGVTPDEVMYIGDTGVDIATGKNANVYKTVGVSWGFRPVSELRRTGADVIVDTPDLVVREALENA